MGLFDFLKKKPPTPQQQPVRQATLSELAGYAEQARAREITGALPEIEATTRAIREKWLALEKRAAELGRKPVRSGIDGEHIAVQSRNSFAKRAQQLFESFGANRFPARDGGFDSFAAFAREFEETLRKLAQALSDNRYLFLFFSEESKGMGGAINELNDGVLALKRALETAGEKGGKYAALSRSISGLQESEKKRAGLERAAREAGEESRAAEEKERRARESLEEGEKFAEKTGREIAGLESEARRAENELTQILAPLQRPFRKLEKILGAARETKNNEKEAKVTKELMRAVSAYSSNPLLALEDGDGAKLLESACGELERNIAGLGLDASETHKVRKAVDAVRRDEVRFLWRARCEAIEGRKARQEEFSAVEKARREFREAGARRQEAASNADSALARVAENESLVRAGEKAVNAAAGALLGLTLSAQSSQ